MIDAPGSFASSRLATSAVTADGETGSPFSSTTKQRVRVTVERQADVRSGFAHVGLQVDEVGRIERIGFRGWGTCRRARSTAAGRRGASAPNTAGAVWPPIPLPASTATFSGRNAARSTNPRR